MKSLKRAIKPLGKRTLDQRTTVAKALAAWRSDLIADLGGLEVVSTQELALIDEAVKTKLILDSVDAWILAQPTLINKRTRAVLPAVRDRNTLVATLRGLLTDLGLRRRAREAPDLGRYLADRYGATREISPPSPGSVGARNHEAAGRGATDRTDESPEPEELLAGESAPPDALDR